MNNTLFFPAYLPDDSNGIIQNGILFELPQFCQAKKMRTKCNNYYNKIRNTIGFHNCPYGFNSYVTVINNSIITFTGLRIANQFAKKKINEKMGLSFAPVISCERFLNLVENNRNIIITELSFSKKEDEFLDLTRHISPNIHEIRKLNREIKSQAEHASQLYELSNIDNQYLKFRIDNIYHTSSLITTRLDFYDWQLNPELINAVQRTQIGMYKKFDKVKRCLTSHSSAKEVNIEIQGESYTTIDGNNLLELLPFLLLENALKYSQRNQNISVAFSQNNGVETIEIASIGPLVGKAEIQTIFQKGVRGKWAEKQTEGTGIGLHFAKQICAANQIQISATCENLNMSVDTIPQGKFIILLSYST